MALMLIYNFASKRAISVRLINNVRNNFLSQPDNAWKEALHGIIQRTQVQSKTTSWGGFLICEDLWVPIRQSTRVRLVDIKSATFAPGHKSIVSSIPDQSSLTPLIFIRNCFNNPPFSFPSGIYLKMSSTTWQQSFVNIFFTKT